MVEILTLLVGVPAAVGIINLFTKKIKYFAESTTFIGLLINTFYIISLYGDNRLYTANGASFNMGISIFTGTFNIILMLCLAVLSIVVYLYSLGELKDITNKNYFYAYLMIAIGLCNGTFLAANFIMFSFFAAALSIPLLGTILISSEHNLELSKKAFIMFAITSLCLMFGTSIVETMQNRFSVCYLNIGIDKIVTLGFILVFIDILSKSSFFPFQFWSVNLTNSEKVSYSLIFPTLILGLIGTYIGKVFLMDIFNLSNITIKTIIYVFLSLGIIVLTVLGFLQNDFRKLIAYIFSSQIGFSLMGLVAGGSYGILGAVLNSVNAIIIASGLYMISGMANYKNKITTGLYIIFTLSFIGVPVFGGYYAHDLIYKSLYNENVLYFAVLILSTFVLGLALTRFMYCLFKKDNDQIGIDYVKLIPTAIMAVFTLLLAVFNNQIIDIISKPLNISFTKYNSIFIDLVTFLIIVQLIIVQLLRFRKKDSEYFNTMCLNIVNNSKTETEEISIYDISMDIFEGVAVISKFIDKIINWFYDSFVVGLIFSLSKITKRIQTGNFSTYIILSVLGFVCILLYVLR